ncbi:MAG: VOC family protein [candidate division KSB1 bacterium]|nr:VOC family protein [candidate division KSB1 bacterium]MDZ7296001.1 VOC family protein [candidate division KSB1 bacterium]MDZ7378017.1 VOC family protein [candidate division KSB1 bacterium]MDZ7386059.1 VOC family protein [candidate division KSB1 bacterium]MDZ7393491.1 VOC family protein [candidate division KSB1 bacterium]
MPDSLDRILLAVRSIEEAVAFYRGVLGARVKMRHPDLCILTLGGIELCLQLERPELADERPVKHGFAFGFSAGDLDAAYNELRTKKDAHVLTTPRESRLGRYFEIVDPDGHIIRFTERR